MLSNVYPFSALSLAIYHIDMPVMRGEDYMKPFGFLVGKWGFPVFGRRFICGGYVMGSAGVAQSSSTRGGGGSL
jgi:hypothetical protein